MIGKVRDLVRDVERIAVLRANALGDFIFALPALDALRVGYPDAELVLIGAPWHERLLRDRPGPVDRVLVVPPAPGIREAGADEPEPSTEALDRFLDAARRERFDLALQMHGGGANSNPLVAGLGARVTAGLRAEDAPPLDRWLRYVYYQPEVVRYLEVAGLVGASPTGLEPRLAATEADLAEARMVLGEPDRPRIALHPGASDPRRRWPADRFAAVADHLVDEGYEVLVTGIPDERNLAEQVVAAARRPVRSVVGELSLSGLIGLYAGCAVVVANDTGPVHVAAALDTPTVGIFWVGNLINCATPLRGRHRPIASWTINCPVCGRDCSREIYPARGGGPACPHRVSFVTDVPVVEVLTAVTDLTTT
ncbi:glycosyltransferase family 9 protein [Plantactinospora endophytica]|uniref:LPS biosynthesis-related glycosyltransferase n=1 Tax=Plantactinospora endophytica TaxID=673535 RepID=A0ABQ4E895_9ACTN|nr:glycosyltransferase family 9 protein [Plantactinospora endophytica]GIG90874.1 LPS biosynthesis-related glycosyltransferase [Plantactinospora endophytica]